MLLAYEPTRPGSAGERGEAAAAREGASIVVFKDIAPDPVKAEPARVDDSIVRGNTSTAQPGPGALHDDS